MPYLGYGSLRKLSKFYVNSSHLMGEVIIPPSKSHTLRAILFGMMGKGKTIIHNYLPSPDTQAMMHAAKKLGATVAVFANRLEIDGLDGKIISTEDVIDSGNSGQVLRFIGCLAALSETYTVITGDRSIRHNRPVKPMLEALTRLGALAESTRQNGYAPIIIKGPLRPGKTHLSGEDSQPVSGLLIAASFLNGPSEINVSIQERNLG